MVRPVWLLIVLAAAWGQDRGSIEGTVTNASTHAPLVNARVRIDRTGGDQIPSQRAVTDASGAFVVDQLRPGDYIATFDASSFVSVASPVVHVANATVRVNAELWPAASLSGRVLDDEGQPAVELPVLLERYHSGGMMTGKTDRDGRFSFPGIAPGVYVVYARPARKVKEGTTLAPTWFPSVTDHAQAERLIARAGAEVSGLEIRLRRTPVWSVEGAAADETGRPLPGVTVKLHEPEDRLPDEATTVTGTGGVFHFTNVRPGEWRLEASGAGREGFARVTVEKHDVNRIALRLSPPFALDGFVERDDPRDASGKRKVSAVSLVPESGEGKGALAFHQQDGSIRFEKVQPGRYTIFPLGYLPGYYVESVKLGDRDVMARPVELTDGAIPFRVVYSAKAGRVRGTVEKCGPGTVALVPQDEALLNGQFIRTAKCDVNGRFEAGSLKPGDYYAFAFDRVDNDALADVMFIRTLRHAAVPVHVEEGKAADVELRVTPWPE